MTSKKTQAPEETITSYKGFTKDFTCMGGSEPFQYAVDETYEHVGVVLACRSGFHACEYPLDVFGYYPPGILSRYAEVEQSGDISRHESDSKVASRKIKIGAEVGIPGIIKAAIEYTTSRCNPVRAKHSTGDQSASSATGYQSASSATGDQSASSATGYRSASSATGDQSASSATGYRSASSATGGRSASSATGYRSASSATGGQSASSATGYRSASSATGDQSASSATGYQSASSATGDQSASSATGYQSASSATGGQSASSATGDQSASSATGDQSASSATGYRSASSATGDQSASLSTGSHSSSQITPNKYGESMAASAIAVGYAGKARAPMGSAIYLAERDDSGEFLAVFASRVGDNGIKPDTWYTLKDGKPVAVSE